MQTAVSAATGEIPVFDFDALSAAETSRDPFPFLIAKGCVSEERAAEIRNDYPEIKRATFVPLAALKRRGAFDAIARDLESPRLAEALGPLLGVDLSAKPRMITVRKVSKSSDGGIHNDSASKIVTMLLYLNDSWSDGGGAVRALRSSKSFDDYAIEVPPISGTVFAFRRTENSWHGHLPYAGLRYVIQTTFLQDEKDIERKLRTAQPLHERIIGFFRGKKA